MLPVVTLAVSCHLRKGGSLSSLEYVNTNNSLSFKMIKVYTKFTVFLILCNIVYTEEEQCFSKDENSNCNSGVEKKYTKETNEQYSHLVKTIENAMKTYEPCAFTNCSCFNAVMAKDLNIFKGTGISEAMINAVRNKGTKYQIFNKKLYRQKDCLFPSRCNGIQHFLLKLAPKLPDMDLIINIRDWPQIYRGTREMGPVFSFSKTNDYADIMYPTWAFWEGGPAISLYPRGLGRWDSHRKSVSEAGNKFSWDNKIEKVFFRGSRTSSERDPLVILSRENPELVDAQYTKNQAWKSDADTLYAPPAAEISLEDHCQYKYLFNFRGVAASFRFKHLFLCKSLVFHVGSEWQEFFYPLLKPWVHYIPVDTHANKEEIKKLIQFAITNNELSKEIVENGFKVIWDHLRMEHINCYWKRLLKRYVKLLKYTPKLDHSLIEINNK